MKRFLVPVLFVAALAFSFAAPAQATSITLVKSSFTNLTSGDSIDTEQTHPWEFVVSHDFGEFNDSFVDTFKFTIADLETLAFRVTTWGHVLSMNFELLDSNGNSLQSIPGLFTDVTGNNATVLTFTDALLAQLLASPYLILKITGAFCSCAGYSVAVFPLPPAVIMFLTALLGMGGIAWHRHRMAGASQAA